MSAKNPRVYFFLLALLIFLSSFVAIAASSAISWLTIAAISLSVAGFACMGFDKSLARSQSLRVPEIVFFGISLLGGTPGVFLGVHFFRHKTNKAFFQFVLLFIFCAQLFCLRLLEISLF